MNVCQIINRKSQLKYKIFIKIVIQGYVFLTVCQVTVIKLLLGSALYKKISDHVMGSKYLLVTYSIIC